MLESVENAITEMPRVRATCATGGTDAANSGPRRISAPSSTACCAPACAPDGEPPSSLIRIWMFGFWNSASAISAAFFMDCAATPALPDADSGRISPTLTWPLPMACCAGPAGADGELLKGLENWLRLCLTPAQADNHGAPSMRPIAVRRVVPVGFGPRGSAPGEEELGLSGPTIASLRSTDRKVSQNAPPERSGGRIQAYCRRIVNQTKGLWPPPIGLGCAFLTLRRCTARERPDTGGLIWRQGWLPLKVALCAQKLPR